MNNNTVDVEESSSLINKKGSETKRSSKLEISQSQGENQDVDEDKKGIGLRKLLLIFLLYFAQGLPIGFFIGSIKLILTQKGASKAALSGYSWIYAPYSFKFLLAPLMDTYFSAKYGRKKIYIVPSTLVCAISNIAGSFFIEDLVSDINVGGIAALAIIPILADCVQDIAVDGWLVSLLSKKNYAKGTAFAGASMLLSFFISFNVFVPLNSVEFINKHLYYGSPRTEPIITLSGFMRFMAVVSIIITFWVAFYREPKVQPRENKKEHVKKIFRLYKQYYKNKNLLKFASFLTGVAIPLSMVIFVFIIELIQAGFEKEVASNLTTVMFPFALIFAYASAKISDRVKADYKLAFWSFVTSSIALIFPMLLLKNFDKETNYGDTIFYIFLMGICATFLATIGRTAFTAKMMHISYKPLASTFVTITNSLSNFGRLIASSLGLLAAEFVDSWWVYGFAMVFTFFFSIWMWRTIIPMEHLTTEDYGFFLDKEDRDEGEVIDEHGSEKEDPDSDDEKHQELQLAENDDEQDRSQENLFVQALKEGEKDEIKSQKEQ